jgi:hypothetical protein
MSEENSQPNSASKQDAPQTTSTKNSFLKRVTSRRSNRRKKNWADEKVVLPGCRVAYPWWITVALGVSLLVILFFAAAYFHMRPITVLILSVLCVFVAFLWRLDSNAELRRRLPTKGWKSEIEPDKQELLTPEEFNSGMRFELTGDDDDDLENHRVRMASRRSRDQLFFARILLGLAPLCLVGALVCPHWTVNGSGGELPQVYNLVPGWVALCPALLLSSWWMHLDWDYNRLMLDDSIFYVLRENPAWLPWLPGKNDQYPIVSIQMADPVYTWWGKRWGHATVDVYFVYGYTNRTKLRLRRVPNALAWCNAINTMVGGGGMPMVGGMGGYYPLNG